MRPSNEQIHRCWTIMAKILGKGVMYPVFAFIHGGTSFFPVILSIQPWLHQAWHCRMATFSACLRWWDGQMCFQREPQCKETGLSRQNGVAHGSYPLLVLQMTKISTAYVISAVCVRVWKPQKSKHIYLVLHPVCHHPSFFRIFSFLTIIPEPLALTRKLRPSMSLQMILAFLALRVCRPCRGWPLKAASATWGNQWKSMEIHS